MSPSSRTRTRRLALIAVAVLTSALVVAACGGGNGDEEPTPTAAVEATEAPPTEAATGSVQVDETFWHAGFMITLGEATLSDGVATIEATFENTGGNDFTFDSQLALMSGDTGYTASSLDEDIPQVPAGLVGDGTFAFEVDADFSLDDAMLIVGGPDENQAIVPIGADATEKLVALEPRQLDVTGSAAAGPVAFEVTGVEVRADLPDWHQEVEDGSLAMIISFDVTVGEGIPIGEGVLQSQNVALTLPDGTSVAVRDDGRSGVNELLQGKEGTTISDLSVRFIIDEPPEGDYTFLVRGPYGPDRADVEGEVTFTVPADDGGATPSEEETP